MSRVRLLEKADSLSTSQLSELFDFVVGQDAEVVLTTECEALIQRWSQQGIPSNVTFMLTNQYAEQSERDLSGYPEFFDHLMTILRDENTALFYDRRKDPPVKRLIRHLVGDPRSQLKYQAEITRHLISSWEILTAAKPTVLHFASTPHSIGSWVMACLAELLGIPVVVVQRCTNPKYYRIALGFRKHREVLGAIKTKDPGHKKAYAMRLKEYLEKFELGYRAAMPYYQKDLLHGHQGLIRYGELIKSHWYRPTWIVNTLRCWRTLNAKSCVINLKNQDYAIFFLHYQPERTTLPEGFGFTQQLNALHVLRQNTPANIHIIVKEHPATFSLLCDPACRSPSFYKEIESMQGVSFVKVTSDNFELIDNAVFTATITGTVAAESLIRGVPAVFFGMPLCSPGVGCHVFEDINRLRGFIDDATKGRFQKHQVEASMIEYLESEVDGAFYFEGGDYDGVGKRKLDILRLLLSKENLEYLLDSFG